MSRKGGWRREGARGRFRYFDARGSRITDADKLARVVKGEATEELLDLYSRQRHRAAVKYVQAQTIANKKMMEERDPAVRARNFDELRRVANDPKQAKAYMRRAALYDSLRDANAVT